MLKRLLLLLLSSILLCGCTAKTDVTTVSFASWGSITEVEIINKIIFSLYGIIIPVIYWTSVICRFVSARKNFGGRIPESLWFRYYPYGFTNIDSGHSLKGLVILLCGIGAGLILFGLLFVFADKKSKENR